jgi:hypothetical protein
MIEGGKMKLLLALILTLSSVFAQGPFGFRAGMTRDQILNLVGKGAVVAADTKDDALALNTAPKPHSAFEEYVLTIAPQGGLVRVTAVGKNISTSVYGAELHSQFVDIRDAIAATYGTPKTYDYLKSGSIWNEQRDFMMGLLKKERALSAYWTGDHPPHDTGAGVSSIGIDGIALSTGVGFIRLVYEFVGWTQYNESVTSKEKSVF